MCTDFFQLAVALRLHRRDPPVPYHAKTEGNIRIEKVQSMSEIALVCQAWDNLHTATKIHLMHGLGECVYVDLE